MSKPFACRSVTVSSSSSRAGCRTFWPQETVVGAPAACQFSGPDVVMEGEDGMHERFRSGWAAWGIDVDRYYLVDTLDDGVVVEHPARGGTNTHGNNPLGFHHLVVDLPQNRGHLLRYPSGDDHQVGLSGRSTENFHPVAG